MKDKMTLPSDTTMGELIEALKQFPQDKIPCWCECNTMVGKVDRIVIKEYSNGIVITRYRSH